MRPEFARMFARDELAAHRETLHATYLQEGAIRCVAPATRRRERRGGRSFRYLYDDRDRLIEVCELSQSGKPRKPILRLDPDGRRGMLLAGDLGTTTRTAGPVPLAI